MTAEVKIADLIETKKELRQLLMRRRHELRVYLNAYDMLLTKTGADEDVKQVMMDLTLTAATHRDIEVELLENAIKKIKEQIKKQEADDARNV